VFLTLSIYKGVSVKLGTDGDLVKSTRDSLAEVRTVLPPPGIKLGAAMIETQAPQTE
jgi:hypothetical protein